MHRVNTDTDITQTISHQLCQQHLASPDMFNMEHPDAKQINTYFTTAYMSVLSFAILMEFISEGYAFTVYIPALLTLMIRPLAAMSDCGRTS
jgi:hypothetical protein